MLCAGLALGTLLGKAMTRFISSGEVAHERTSRS
jgi:hypothetical protein